MAYGYKPQFGPEKPQVNLASRGFGYGMRGLPQIATPPPLPSDWMNQAKTTQDRGQWFDLKRLYQQQPGRSDEDAYHQALYSNPLAGQFDTETGHRGGLLSRIKGAGRSTFGYDTRLAAAKIAAIFGGITAAAGGPVAAGAGGAGGGGGAAAAGGGLTAGQAAAAGVDPFLAGGGLAGGAGMGAGGALGAAGAAGSGGGAAMAAGAGGGGFHWAPVIQGGSQLLSGYMNKRASDKASNQSKQNIQAALAQLSPEAIRQLVQMFYTQNYAMLNPAMQSAQRGIAAGAGRTGLTGAGVTRQLQAGIPGQFSNMALGAASQQGLGVAGQRAGLYGNAPVSMPYSFGNDLQGIMQMLGRYGILRNNQQQTQPSQQNQWWISGPGYDDNEYR